MKYDGGRASCSRCKREPPKCRLIFNNLPSRCRHARMRSFKKTSAPRVPRRLCGKHQRQKIERLTWLGNLSLWQLHSKRWQFLSSTPSPQPPTCACNPRHNNKKVKTKRQHLFLTWAQILFLSCIITDKRKMTRITIDTHHAATQLHSFLFSLSLSLSHTKPIRRLSPSLLSI